MPERFNQDPGLRTCLLYTSSGHPVSGCEHGEKTETHCTEEFQDSTPFLIAVIVVDCRAHHQRDAQSKVKARILPAHTAKARGSEL